MRICEYVAESIDRCSAISKDAIDAPIAGHKKNGSRKDSRAYFVLKKG